MTLAAQTVVASICVLTKIKGRYRRILREQQHTTYRKHKNNKKGIILEKNGAYVPYNNIPDVFLWLAERNELELETAVLTDGGRLPVHRCHLPALNLDTAMVLRTEGQVVFITAGPGHR